MTVRSSKKHRCLLNAHLSEYGVACLCNKLVVRSNMILGSPRSACVPHATGSSTHPGKPAMRTVKLPVTRIDSESFRPYGQVVSATNDGKGFDNTDAQLQLDQGTPRFYIMRIPRRGLTFDRITYHAKVTQCLGGLSPDAWFLTVAAPSGSVEKYPKTEDLKAFRIPHGSFVKLHAGTWHAGPLFQEPEEMDFYNLELSDTNVVDHATHVYSKSDGITFELTEDSS